MIKINAALIIKDDSEIDSLNRCLDSLQPYVDGVYLTSTARPDTKIKRLCAKRGVHYSHFQWIKDFSAARNFNFSQVPADTDYIYWQDVDDVLIHGELLRPTAEQAKQTGKDVVFFTYWYGCDFNGPPAVENFRAISMEQMRERLLKPGVTVWKGRLHETPIPVSGVKNRYTSLPYDKDKQPMVIMHMMTNDEAPSKMKRNREILEMQLMEERARKDGADPRTLLYLMKIYAELNEPELWTECLLMGREYLDKSGWDEERATCLEQMAICYGKMGDYQSAIDHLHLAIATYPYQPLHYLRLAIAYFNLKKYDRSEYWMNIAATMEIKHVSSNSLNLKAMKLMLADLMLKLNYNVHKNTKKALEAAQMVYREDPSKEHAEQVAFLEDVENLNEACKHTDELSKYLHEIGESERIPDLIESLPDGISNQPFAIKLRQKFTPPRKWGRNEICYFANFGSKHFEQWDSSSLKSGIGGSETAVIELAKEWTKMGYKVTVYGDPFTKGVDEFGITWLPWYYFNAKDYFNIFIQWRNWQLSDKIKCRKFLVDLHDLWNSVDVGKDQLNGIDKFMVKSNYHRSLGADLPDDKFAIIGNGVRV